MASRSRPIAARRSPYGIARARRPLPEPERDVERVDLVRGREHAAGLGRRQRRVRRVGQVLLVDRGADGLGIAGEPRVLGADVTLELGELAHELGRLVGLREPRRLERRLAAAERLDELRQPLGLVRERAGALEERDRAEPLRERCRSRP